MSAYRAPLLKEFSTMEKLVVALLGRGETYKTTGQRLHIAKETAKYHAQRAAAKIPGDLPALCKIMFWTRGATLEQLEGGNWVPQSPSKAEMAETRVGAEQGREEYPLY